MSLRVLQVMAGAPHGGAETFYVTLTTALHRAGVETIAVTRPNDIRDRALGEAGVPIVHAPFRKRFDFVTGRRILKAAAEQGTDVALNWMERAAAMCPKGPYTVAARLGGYYSLKYYKTCDHLVCITPDLVRHVIAQGWPAERVTYIPNFPVIFDEPAADRASLDTPEAAPLLVALGRLHRAKAFDVLLEAMTQVPRAHLWIAGEGPDRAELEARAERLGVAPRVRFLGWRTDRTALLKAADICVFPSRYEPNGTVVVEAWAHKVPLVATRADGPRWIANDGEDAVLVEIDNADALAAGIKRVLDDPEFAADLVARGAARVEAEFSEGRIIDQYKEFFERVKPGR